jgi:hypothetical protein
VRGQVGLSARRRHERSGRACRRPQPAGKPQRYKSSPEGGQEPASIHHASIQVTGPSFQRFEPGNYGITTRLQEGWQHHLFPEGFEILIHPEAGAVSG